MRSRRECSTRRSSVRSVVMTGARRRCGHVLLYHAVLIHEPVVDLRAASRLGEDVDDRGRLGPAPWSIIDSMTRNSWVRAFGSHVLQYLKLNRSTWTI